MRALLLLSIAVPALGGCAGAQLAAGFRIAHPECREHVDHTERANVRGVFDASACGLRDTGFHVPATSRYNFGGEAARLASFELNCPLEAISVTVLDRDHAGIEGCGLRLVYMSTRNGWVLNSRVDAMQLNDSPPPQIVVPAPASSTPTRY